MKKPWAVAGAVLLSASAAYADHYQQYFPLKKGNSWTYLNQKWGNDATMKVADSYYGIHYVDGLLGGKMWVGFGGNTLYTWDEDASQWRALFRFGAAVGTKYMYGSNLQVTVESKSAEVYDSLFDHTFKNCIRFTFQHIPMMFDAGLMEMTFAPNVGLITSASQSIVGPVSTLLKSAVLNGKKLGLISYSALESGSMTGVQISGTNKAFVINTSAAWTNFYKKHKPGATVPAVNFYKNTVLVVLAGNRPTGGYTLGLQYVRWEFPSNTAKVSVVEEKPGAGTVVTQSTTRPFEIVVLDQKVYNVSVKWNVIFPAPGPIGNP